VNSPAVVEATQEFEAPRTRDYAELVGRVRELVQSCVPEGATVAVVSKGDTQLLRLTGCIGWHFPRTESGVYAGHHPADDSDAIARLEKTRADGANFLLVPATAYWWLDHYAGFRRHLESRYRRVADSSDTAIVFSLEVVAAEPQPPVEYRRDAFIGNVRAVAAGLLPAGSRVIVATRGDDRLLDLGGPIGWHFPQLQGGYYAGDDPADSSSAVAHLELLRTAGAEYLLIPQTAHWWLERYGGLRNYLQQAYALVTRQENVCTIYDLQEAAAYDEIVEAVREAAVATIPVGATALVASNGDSRLMEVTDRHAWHFPQSADRGDPVGHLASDAHAIALLEELRAQGAGYLVLPRTVFWWLAHYADFARHLDSGYRRVRSDRRCIIYDLAINHPEPVHRRIGRMAPRPRRRTQDRRTNV
jgi:hypothetical protein